MTEQEKLSTGTTTIGLVCKDCVVMAADRRITAGNMIMMKNYQKIKPVSDNMVLTVAGVVSDVQLVTKYLRSETKLKAIRSGRKILLKEAANLLSTWSYSMLRGSYAIGHYLLGGFDKTGGIYDINPDGALTLHEDYVVSGSGSVFAMGVLETLYKPGLTEEEGIQVVTKAIDAAMQRDSASGNGFDIYVASQDAVRHVVSKEINTKITA